MATVTWQELRDLTDAILVGAAAGDEFEITVDGRPVARLSPFDGRPRTMSSHRFVRRILGARADAALRADLTLLAPDTTDDLAWPPD